VTRCTLGLVAEVHHGLGVYRGPPEVYLGPCVKVTPWKTPIIFTTTAYRAVQVGRGYLLSEVLREQDLVDECVSRYSVEVG